jgi:hypothetical protein
MKNFQATISNWSERDDRWNCGPDSTGGSWAETPQWTKESPVNIIHFVRMRPGLLKTSLYQGGESVARE